MTNKYFRTFAIDGFFPHAVYQRLLETFPARHLAHPLMEVGVKYNLNESHSNVMQAFPDTSPEWVTFYQKCKNIPSMQHILAFLGIDVEFHLSKFEFSWLPADGGCVYPHPDTPRKVATLVFMFPPREWEKEWGGGFECYKHKTRSMKEDFSGFRETHWDNMETIETFDYVPNRVIVFHRSNCSLHGVRPCRGPRDIYRQSVTVNFINKKLQAHGYQSY